MHLILTKGALALLPADQEPHDYQTGAILAVPCQTMMEARSLGPEPLEFFAAKAPDAWPL